MEHRSKKWDRLGPNKKKVLLLLFGGVGLSLAKTPGQYFKVVKGVSEEWQKINYQALRRAIKSLYESKLVNERDNPDGTLTIVLTNKGKEKALTYNIDTMTIAQPKRWDGQWRLVLFDIPERRREARDALRSTLRRLGFYEYQKSAFIYPYQCQEEMDYIIEFFRIRPYVRLITARKLDNELHLKDIFGLM
ncbi:MAG: hypothetical protein AAB642_00155 [Patescibacteria group bacterium]